MNNEFVFVKGKDAFKIRPIGYLLYAVTIKEIDTFNVM